MKVNLKKKEQIKSSLKKIISHFLVDVETCNYQRIIMELSFMIVSKFYTIPKKFCFIIKEVWENEEYRNGIFAKDKIKHWQEMLDNGTAQLISIYKLYNFINKIIKEEGITVFTAFNANFDYLAIANTYHRYGIDKRENYEKENQLLQLQKFDLWEYATKIYCTEEYVNWAIKNEKFTPKGKLQSNAQAIYQFLTRNNKFEETHFGIEDLQIEYTIFMSSVVQNTLNRNNKVILNKNGNWRTIENFRKEKEKVA